MTGQLLSPSPWPGSTRRRKSSPKSVTFLLLKWSPARVDLELLSLLLFAFCVRVAWISSPTLASSSSSCCCRHH